MIRNYSLIPSNRYLLKSRAFFSCTFFCPSWHVESFWGLSSTVWIYFVCFSSPLCWIGNPSRNHIDSSYEYSRNAIFICISSSSSVVLISILSTSLCYNIWTLLLFTFITKLSPREYWSTFCSIFCSYLRQFTSAQPVTLLYCYYRKNLEHQTVNIPISLIYSQTFAQNLLRKLFIFKTVESCLRKWNPADSIGGVLAHCKFVSFG